MRDIYFWYIAICLIFNLPHYGQIQIDDASSRSLYFSKCFNLLDRKRARFKSVLSFDRVKFAAFEK